MKEINPSNSVIAFIDVPIVHQSVVWWRTLHQGATVLNPSLSPKIHGEMAMTLLLGFISFTFVYAWMLMHRYQIAILEQKVLDAELDQLIEERRREPDSDSRLARPTDDVGSIDQPSKV